MGGVRKLLRGFGDAISAGRVIRACAGDFCSQRFTEGDNAIVIGSDNEVIEFSAEAGTLDDVLQQWLSEKWVKRLSGEAGGGPTGRDDTNDKSFWVGNSLLLERFMKTSEIGFRSQG